MFSTTVGNFGNLLSRFLAQVDSVVFNLFAGSELQGNILVAQGTPVHITKQDE